MTKKQAIETYMKNLQISYEEAEQLWEDDQEDFIGEDGEEMTKKAKEIKRYEKGESTQKKKSTKERKVDESKKYLLEVVSNALTPLVNITEIKTETEIKFVYNAEEYTLKLTKHRPKK